MNTLSISIEEFSQLSVARTNSPERTYQGKSFKPGPIFSLLNPSAAQLYCQRLSKVQNQAMCIIVETEEHLQIWSEDVVVSKIDPVDSFLDEGDKIPFDSSLVQPEFVALCQKKLATYIGPISQVICKKAFSKKKNLTRIEFVETIAKKIPDPKQSSEFKRELLG
ncbi:MAG: hypothetical protein ACFCAD_27045 [Pleurocapsa sp.]